VGGRRAKRAKSIIDQTQVPWLTAGVVLVAVGALKTARAERFEWGILVLTWPEVKMTPRVTRISARVARPKSARSVLQPSCRKLIQSAGPCARCADLVFYETSIRVAFRNRALPKRLSDC
jgi:hypothetical protein